MINSIDFKYSKKKVLGSLVGLRHIGKARIE